MADDRYITESNLYKQLMNQAKEQISAPLRSRGETSKIKSYTGEMNKIYSGEMAKIGGSKLKKKMKEVK